MEFWWIVLAVVILAAIAVLYAVLRGRSQPPRVEDTSSARDFVAERETSRMGNLSAEDQAWQASSQERDRANQKRTPPAA